MHLSGVQTGMATVCWTCIPNPTPMARGREAPHPSDLHGCAHPDLPFAGRMGCGCWQPSSSRWFSRIGTRWGATSLLAFSSPYRSLAASLLISHATPFSATSCPFAEKGVAFLCRYCRAALRSVYDSSHSAIALLVPNLFMCDSCEKKVYIFKKPTIYSPSSACRYFR